MRINFERIMEWWRYAVEGRPKQGALRIGIEAWIAEEGGPEIQLEIEIRRVESEMMELIRELCGRKNEVELRISIDEIGEEECQDSMSA
ncbi:MAG: hypothetical protein RKO24_12880 [Candidatus Competibacter sp.]|nr:hypothetical protein [Candidatus Competibacter sp.]